MGIRVYFSRGSRDGALGHFLAAPLTDFRAWYVDESKRKDGWFFGGDQENSDILALIDRVLGTGQSALLPRDRDEAQRIDLMVCRFYRWCNWERQEILGEELTGTSYSSRYHEVAPRIRMHCGDEAARLWDYIRTGRAIGRPESSFPYTPEEAAYPNSFWTYDETAFLYDRLLPFNGAFINSFGEENGIVAECAFEAAEIGHSEGIGVIIEVA